MWPNLQETTFTEKTLDGKLNFLCNIIPPVKNMASRSDDSCATHKNKNSNDSKHIQNKNGNHLALAIWIKNYKTAKISDNKIVLNSSKRKIL